MVGLRLGANRLNGTIPATIGKLSALRTLKLQWNEKLTGTIPAELYDLTNLEVLALGFSGLTGELSPRVGQLTKLDTLDLRTSPWAGTGNFEPNPHTLSGALPKEIGQLANLRSLDLGRQKFSGNIPAEIGQLAKLERLSLENNAFTGEIPATIGNLGRLWMLMLNDNQLTGAIPAEMTKMAKLSALFLSDNKLLGVFPAGFAGEGMATLAFVDVTNNNLTGALPTPVLHSWYAGSEYIQTKFPGLEAKGYTEFWLKGNRFAGVLPAEYMRIKENYTKLVPQQTGYGFDNLSVEEAQKHARAERPEDKYLIDVPAGWE